MEDGKFAVNPKVKIPDSHEYEKPEPSGWDVWIVVSEDRYKTGLMVSAGTKTEAEKKATIGIERFQDALSSNQPEYVEFEVMVRKVSSA